MDERIKRNVAKLKAAGATDQDIADYVKTQTTGTSLLGPSAVADATIMDPTKIARGTAINQGIDPTTGASIGTRALMSGISPKDQLATLRQDYPDAQPYGDGNFVFTDPKSGEKRLMNPPGFELGDVAGQGRNIALGVGGVAGEVAGTALMPGLGTAAGTGIGAAAAGQAYDAIAAPFRKDARNVSERINEFGTDAVINTLLPVGIGLGGKAARAMFKPVGSKLGSAGIEQVAGAFERQGVKMPIGSLGNKGIQAVESALSELPASAGTMQSAATRSLDQTSGAARRVAESFGPVMTKEGAGGVVRSGAKDAVAWYKQFGEKLFTGIDKKIGKQTLSDVTNTEQTFQSLLSELQSTPEIQKMTSKQLMNIYETFKNDALANGGQIPYGALKALRTKIGSQLGNPVVSTISDVSGGQAKMIYGALTRDMEAAAEKAGVLSKFQKANSTWSKIMNEDIPILESLQKSGMDEAAYNALYPGAKDGGTRLRVIMRNLDKPSRDMLAGTALGRMGLAKAGAQNVAGDVWSPNTFLTNWNNLAPEAKKVLFGGSRYAGLQKGLDDILTISGSLKEAEAMANKSRSGTVLGAMGTFFYPLQAIAEGRASEAMGRLATTTVAPFAAAKLMTNDAFVRWLGTGMKIAARAGKGVDNAVITKQMLNHTARLGILAKENDDIKDELRQYASELGMDLGDQDQ